MEKPGRYQDVYFTRTWEDTPIPTSAPASWGFKKHLRGNKKAAVPTEQLGAGQINKILIYVGILFSCLAGGADPLQGVSSLSTTAHLFLRDPHGPAQGNTCSKSCACAVKLIKDQSAMSNCKLECLSPQRLFIIQDSCANTWPQGPGPAACPAALRFPLPTSSIAFATAHPCISQVCLLTVSLGLCICYSCCLEHQSCTSSPTCPVPLAGCPDPTKMGEALPLCSPLAQHPDSVYNDSLFITDSASRGCLAFSKHTIPSFHLSVLHLFVH